MSGIDLKQMDIWKKYHDTRDGTIREKLILEYSPLVKYVAGRLSIYFGNNVDYEDLLSYGVFGLIDAIDKFDVSKGVKFETYASLRIRGAIIDNVRKLDWVPRTLRQKNKEFEKVMVQLENELGRSPDDQEIADRLGIDLDEFHKTMSDLNISHLISLDEYMEQNYEMSVEVANTSQYGNPDNYTQFNEIKAILADTIDKLPEKEKIVITLYYFEELTLKEISAIMKVSESRISQLHSKAVGRLSVKLNKHRSILYEE
ncbi:FliA/WhiG family RNA polymerase sigma factor [Petroclostridium sp. X23]|jgi:RNA polymerase sigma factor for flagellar operon FliA|uniref:FliA/WhiG family RNA polymerase sigma factor n=1 Tax=Petroclostridium sp. X23 TaxID=3045146 RepID=UPI0024AD3488|nr:FliA/WhiG family RNA polymerase sigma factor [Petroclostridium sp. X23]WHH58962.1 FliA/WhiG family RNA polymerase sigma factor [Petroclostridium sp. X23]